jgi:hypothetical protein
VALSPNLETVDISIGNIDPFPPISSTNGYTEQEERSVSFKVRNPSRNPIKILSSQQGDEVDYLESATNLQMLETLEINEIPPSFENNERGTMLPSLKNLSVRIGPGGTRRQDMIHQALANFLSTCPSLYSLQLSCCAPVLPSYLAIVSARGSQLRILKVHEAETVHGRGDGKRLELNEIRRVCPLLTDIRIDINTSTVDGTSELDFFHQLGRFPFLNTIRLHFAPIQNQVTANNPFQRENSEWVENIWCVLRESKMKYGTVWLQELHISMGEQVRTLGPGIAALGARWEATNQLDIIATLSDRGDMPNEIVVVTKIKGAEPRASRERRQIPGSVRLPDGLAFPVHASYPI